MEITTDINKINSVLKHPDIWSRVSDKSQNIDEFTPPMDGITYLYEEGVLIILHPEGDKHRIHVNVILEHRDKALAATAEAFKYGFEVLGAREIIAKIPEKYGSVYGFALKFMNDNGIIDGDHILSLEKEEWAL